MNNEAGKPEQDKEPEINQWCLIWIGSEVPIVACYKGEAKFIAHQSLEIWEKEDITNWMPVPNPSQPSGEEKSQDELWKEFGADVNFGNPYEWHPSVIKVLKSKYIIKRKP